MSRYTPMETALRKVKADTLDLVEELPTRQRQIALDAIAHIGRAALNFETLALLDRTPEPPKPDAQ